MKQLILLVFLLFSPVFAQTTVNHLIVPSGFTLESFSGYGYSKTMSNQSNIASMNPAALDRFTSISLGVSYQYETDLTPGYIANIGTKRYKVAVPQSAGIVLPYKDLRIGLGFSQKYNSSLIFGDVPITTMENPDGTGDFMNVNDKSDLFRYSGMISYAFRSFINESDRFSLGFSVNYDLLNYNYSSGKKGFEADRILRSHGNKMTYSFGITYSFLNSSLISLFYEKGVEFDKMTTDENISRGIYANSYLFRMDDRAVSREPDKFHLGFDHSFTDKSQLTTTLSYVLWNATDQNKQDQAEASASYIYSLSNDFMTSLGLFYTDLNYKDNILFDSGRFRSLYMTAGAVYSLRFTDLDLTVADSHLLSGEARKETLVKLSSGFHL